MFGQASIYDAPRNRWARVSAVTQARIDRLPFAKHPGFRVNFQREGYKNYTFGAKSGPCAGFDALAHELAHAVEFGPENFEQRCSQFGFVFSMATIEVLGDEYPNPITGQASEREARTFGIEWQLCEAVGIHLQEKEYLRHVCGALGFLPDWLAYHQKPDEVAALVHQAREQFSLAEVFDRMIGWLDLTQERLRLSA